MVEHTCDKCSKKFKTKSSYIRHTNRKNPCNKQIGKVNSDNNACTRCGKKFNSYDTL